MKNYFVYKNSYNKHKFEDEGYVCKTFGFVIDGATGLTGEHFSNNKSDAQWLAKNVKAYLKKHLKSNLSTIKILKNCVAYISKKYNIISKGQYVIDKPCCCIALFREIKDKIEIYLIGDCEILIELNNGEVLRFIRNDHINLDENSHKEIKQFQKANSISYLNAANKSKQIFLKNRLKKNTEEGYYIFCDDINVIDHGTLKSFNKQDIKKIVMVSDGFAQYYDLFNISNYITFLKNLKDKKTANNFYNTLLSLQLNDSECDNYNRFKISDDSTLLYWTNKKN